MSIPVINVDEARSRLTAGSAVLVDIREPMEHAREAIPGALPAPLSSLQPMALAGKQAVIFHCQSGRRTGGRSSSPAARRAYV